MVTRYKEIKEKIQSNFSRLPKNQRYIADYIIDNFDKIPFLTVEDVSEKTEVSVASVVRFAQRIGFSGFSELRDVIAESLQHHLKKNEVFPLFKKEEVADDILTSVANIEIKNINETLLNVDRDAFKKSVSMIIRSLRVFTSGLEKSYLLAEILAYQLNQVGIDAAILKHSYTNFKEQLLFLNKKDILIAFSFPDYSIETIEAAKFARSRGMKVIGITNKPTAPITFYSDQVLLVKIENMLFTNSFAAVSVMINALATEIARSNKSHSTKYLKELSDIVNSEKSVLKEI